MLNRNIKVARSVALCIFITTIFRSAISGADNAADTTSTNENERFPIERFNLIFVPVTLFEKEETFYVDTGTSTMLLDKRRFERRLGKPLETVAASGSVTTQRIALFKSPSLVVGHKLSTTSGDGRPIACADLSQLGDFLGKDVTGIVGMDFLKSKVLRVDFDAGYASFPKAASNPSEKSERLTFLNTGAPSVRVQIADEGFHSFMVDTGSNGIVTLEPPLFARLLKSKQIVLRPDVSITDVGGESKQRRGILSRLTIGSYQFSNLNVDETRSNSIGMAFLQRFVSEFDFVNRRLYLYRSRSTYLPELRTLTGFGVKGRNGSIVVTGVAESEHQSEIQNDDLVIRVNDRPVNQFTLTEIQILCMVPDSKLKLTLERCGQRFDVTVDLKRIPDPFPSVLPEEDSNPSDK